MDLVRFVTNFFLSKKVFLITAFTCWTPDATLELMRSLTAAGMKVRVYPLPLPGWGRGQLTAYDVHREGVLLDVACPRAAAVLQQASSRRAFIHRYTWLLVDRDPAGMNVARIESLLAAVDALPDSDLTWCSTDGVADVYRAASGGPLVTTPLPLTLAQGYSLAQLEALWSRRPTAVARRRNLGNISITSGTIITQPQHFKGWSDVSNRQIDTYPKLTYPLLMLLADDLNFRHDMVQVDLYGEESNGTFDGLAGRLQAGTSGVELGVASMFMRGDRWRVLHFAAETVGLTGAFIFRQPAQSAVSNVFLLPLSAGVWGAGAGLAAVTAVLVAALARHHRLRRLSLPEAATFAVGALCQQGFEAPPPVTSVRVAMFSMLACALFLFTAYSAKVVALLQAPSDALHTVADLAASPLRLAVQDTTYKRVYFAESSEPGTQQLYRRKLLPLGDAAYMSVVEGVARLRTGLFAFQVETSSGYDIISKTFREEEKCGLKEIQAFKLPMVAVPIRKHSGYRELVAARLRWQRETGLMGRARRVWLAERPRCAAAAARAFRSVRLVDVMPALQMAGAGAAVAVLLLACELLAHGAARRALPPAPGARERRALPPAPGARERRALPPAPGARERRALPPAPGARERRAIASTGNRRRYLI